MLIELIRLFINRTLLVFSFHVAGWTFFPMRMGENNRFTYIAEQNRCYLNWSGLCSMLSNTLRIRSATERFLPKQKNDYEKLYQIMYSFSTFSGITACKVTFIFIICVLMMLVHVMIDVWLEIDSDYSNSSPWLLLLLFFFLQVYT